MSERCGDDRSGRAFVSGALLIAIALAVPFAAEAHDARPLSVAIVEQGTNVYRVVVQAPPSLPAGNVPRILWPEACDIPESSSLSGGFGESSLISCRGGLTGRTVEVAYPVYNPSITTLFRLELSNGSSRTAVLPPDVSSWTIPPEPTPWTVARDYTVLGFRHIWGGPDHLLFVAGLMLLARGGRRLLLAVTGFTAAHSITLSLAALGVVRLPIAPIEAMIALSILFLAAEVARADSASFSHRYPIALSFVFGLLHGFGFASALGEIGLPTGGLAAGLVFFNLGVEAGQISFIAAVLLAVFTARGRRAYVPGIAGSRRLTASATLVSAYVLGVPAAFWFIERTWLAFSA